jgi:hypothetical protein
VSACEREGQEKEESGGGRKKAGRNSEGFGKYGKPTAHSSLLHFGKSIDSGAARQEQNARE